MKITYNWLKEFVNFKNSPQDIATILTSMGPEVVSIKPIGITHENSDKILLTKVLEVKKHPNADNLKIITLESGKKQVITNSQNISKDDYVIYAKPDTILPNGFNVKKVAIKSIESDGMLLAKEHLNLEEKSSDIFILGKDKKKAEFLFNLYCEEDYLFEIELTANRSDCLSVLGIARELSAALNLPLNIPLPVIEANLDEIPVVEVIDDENCPRYSARILRDVKVMDSPEWIKRKLELCGIRAINNIVDATNYILLELGHPMHAFDLNLLEGEKICVRKAFKNESITALDGVKYELSNEMLVIADDKKPVAIAGIMGGEYSGVVENTKNILLESAYFNPLSIRKTAKKLGLRTESSYRFERGTDWEITTKAIERATEIIMLTCSPKISRIRDEYNNVFKDRIIKVRADFVSEKIGVSFSLKDLEQLLKRLHFTVVSKEKDFLEVKIPSFRADVSRQIDIVEEISRLYGYNNIPQNNFKPPIVVKNLGFKRDIYWLLRDTLLNYGFTECYNYSFCGEDDVKIFGLNQDEMIKLQNPMSADISLLRPYLTVNLMKTLDYNIKSVYKNDLRLFEYGRTFKKKNKTVEKKVFCGIMYGKNYDYYNISGVVEGLLDKVAKKRIDYERIELSFLHPINSAKIKFDGKDIGFVGEIHPDVREKMDIKGSVYVFELEVEDLIEYLDKSFKVQKFSKLPPVMRDLSIVVNKNIIARSIMNEIALSSELIKDVEFKDIFESSQIGPENKSLTFSITFSHPERTLTDEEVNSIVNDVVNKLKEKFNAELR